MNIKKINSYDTTTLRSLPVNGTHPIEGHAERKIHPSLLMKLFENGLKEIYWAENVLVTAIPELIKNVTSRELHKILTVHLEETIEHVSRLNSIFEMIEMKAQGKKCEAMEGLMNEALEIIEFSERGSMCDAGIILAMQKIEHYEISLYGTLRQFAETMELYKVTKLLEATLDEEIDADLDLTDVALETINTEAAKVIA